jgi:hypothetical protein
MTNFLKSYPEKEKLLGMYPESRVLPVNSHIHTPYSFSAFDSIPQIFEMARKEHMAALGINDFFVTDGYEPFCKYALQHGIFPMFNIEFISLLKEEQAQHIRINDPNNPGRCYFCGKGLDSPFALPSSLLSKLGVVIDESQQQVKEMIERCNSWFTELGIPLQLNYLDIRRDFAQNLVRERHIAKAIRYEVSGKYPNDVEQKNIFRLLFSGKDPVSDIHDGAALENEIRTMLLKSGGKAFVEENERAFMSLDDVIEIILAAGGIPCYPVLLDDKNGNYTEYERDPAVLHQQLSRRNIRCIELIPGRNSQDHLLTFVKYFHDRDYVILFGTEHNTPDMIPLTCDTRGHKPLPGLLHEISWKGACVIAAHQYCRVRGLPGFSSGIRPSELHSLGNAVIFHTIENYRNHG